jgi:hypothetical protein
MCCPKGKCGCQYFILRGPAKSQMTFYLQTILVQDQTFHLCNHAQGVMQLLALEYGPGFFFNKKLILDYYFCLKSGPVFLFQIFIIAPLPLPRDIKLYH